MLHNTEPAPPSAPLVLVADDDPDIAYLLGAMLSDAGYRVEQQTSLPAVAQRLVHDPLPDLMVLDIKMGADDATVLVRRLRTEGRTMHLPVLFISARVDAMAAAAAVDSIGLAKPFEMRTLLATVAGTISTRRDAQP